MRRLRALRALLLAIPLLTACSAVDGETGSSAGAATLGGDEPRETASSGSKKPLPSDPGKGPRPTIDAFPGSKVFMPDQTPAPGIVMLHGSEGGSEPFIQEFAQEIAQRGFVVVTLCWFGCDGKPDKIDRIPLESVLDIGNWLAAAPEVGGGKIGLFGWSRGAEMSLLLTSVVNTTPFAAVAVHAPSDTIVGGFDPATAEQSPEFGALNETDPKTGQEIPAPAWTWKGKPVFGERTLDEDAVGPKIAVEKYTGPVYVSQGEKDEVWDVSRGKAVVAARKAVSGLVTKSHFFPGEGHVFEDQQDRDTETGEISDFFQENLGE